MPWKDEEIQSLIEQINAGVPYRNLKIPGKTLPAIGQQRIRLCRRGILDWSVIPPKATWTTREIGLLIQQVNQGKHLGQIVILGKTQHAISEQRKRQIKLETCTFHSARPSKSSRRPWTTKEVRHLRHLTIAEGQTAQTIYDSKIFPGRSKDAISKLITRWEFGHPRRIKQSQEAIRLPKEARDAIKAYLLTEEGMSRPSREIAVQWGINPRTVRVYRSQIGIKLSWEQSHRHLLNPSIYLTTVSG